MDFYKALIEIATYLMHIVSYYVLIDIAVNHYYVWVYLRTQAEISVGVSKTVMDISLQMAERNSKDLSDSWTKAAVLNHAEGKWHSHLSQLGYRVASASARFALFKSAYLDDLHSVFPYQENLFETMDRLKTLYVEIERLSPADAEQKIIDDTMFAIANLDFKGEIFGGSPLGNPAEDHYRKVSITGKERSES